ncbi:hypothetical protein D3C87_1912100 [compost metagenome]
MGFQQRQGAGAGLIAIMRQPEPQAEVKNVKQQQEDDRPEQAAFQRQRGADPGADRQ